MNRRISFVRLLLAAISVPLSVFGQQDPQFSQHMFARLPINPGYAGSNEAICASLLYRNQWTGYGGEPKTALFNFDMPVDALHGGVGLSVYASDRLGPENNLNIRGAYAYRMNLGSGNLGLGVDFGYHQKSFNADFVYNDLGDNRIPMDGASGGSLDFGFGLYYNSEKLYVGLSSTHLQEGEINYDNFRSTLARHYWLMAGYSAELSPSLTLKPALLVKTDAVSTQFDFNANLLINNRFWVGGGYRLEDAVIIMAGIDLVPNLKLGYSYDFTTSAIRTYSTGTHEVMLGYCFRPVKATKRMFHRNVRML
ncbi:MAG: type IX secretion system membrane protein PorP/SprF [Bacteroidota bacterium]